MGNELPFYSIYSPAEIASLRVQLKEFAEEARKITRESGVKMHPRVVTIKAALLAQRDRAQDSES